MSRPFLKLYKNDTLRELLGTREGSIYLWLCLNSIEEKVFTKISAIPPRFGSRQQVRTSIKKLIQKGLINQQSTSNSTTITLNNSLIYEYTATTKKSESNHQAVTLYNNNKNYKNIEPNFFSYDVVLQIFTKNGFPQMAELYYDFRKEKNWLRANGEPVKNLELDIKMWISRSNQNKPVSADYKPLTQRKRKLK